MSLSPLYRQLAELAGIETRYRDVWGVEKEVSRETVEALLAAMGLSAPNETEAQRGLNEIEAARWEGLLEPIIVVLEDSERIAVPFRAFEGAAGHFSWQVTDEDGVQHAGTGSLTDCRIVAKAGNEGIPVVEYELVLPPLPQGYHSLLLRLADREATAPLIVTPRQCFLPETLRGSCRVWGVTTQLYALRSARNWGIGDFSDLAHLGEVAAQHEARAIGVNPLHALFPAEPRHISPYSPSSRLFLNDLYIDPEAVPDFAECDDAREWLAASQGKELLAHARAAEFVDYVAVAGCKRPIFEVLFRSFRDRHLGRALTERGRSFREFQRIGGRVLRDFATFTALQQTMIDSGLGFSWKQWPLSMRDPASPDIAAFAEREHERIEQVEYLQWEADRQLGEAASRGNASGLSLGIYRDLAVGVDSSGAEAWAMQDILVPGATIGAPPDLLNRKGQNWGLVPTAPLALRRRGMLPFIAGLRANMRHAGALRIDHVMGLRRLYWVPPGMKPDQGAFVAYPFEEFLRILALESHRHRCAVIGEDLGTVPEGFRERMQDANVLSYRVLVFERQPDGSFTAPDQYPELAAASVATHDIATLRGYWTERDIAWRTDLDLYPSTDHRQHEAEERVRERLLLLEALVREELLSSERTETLVLGGGAEFWPELRDAVHAYLGRTAARFALVQAEDMAGELEQPNLPGTTDEHPNWRRKLGLTVEEMFADPGVLRLIDAVNAARRESAARLRGAAR